MANIAELRHARAFSQVAAASTTREADAIEPRDPLIAQGASRRCAVAYGTRDIEASPRMVDITVSATWKARSTRSNPRPRRRRSAASTASSPPSPSWRAPSAPALAPVAVLAMGVSNVLADAMSMGVGEYLSSRSYNNYVLREKEREAWELENHPEGEIDEMVELFEQRGMGHDDAVEVIKRMSKYKEFFVNIMMTEELALPVPDPEDEVNSRKEGVVMFLAFAAFGMLPIVGFVAAPLPCRRSATPPSSRWRASSPPSRSSASAPSRRPSATRRTCARAPRPSRSAASAPPSPSSSAAPSAAFAEESVPALFVDRPGYYWGTRSKYGAR